MASAAEVAKLRARARTILTSVHCNKIRFVLGNIRIQYLMYGYIGDAISRNKVRVIIGDGNAYYPSSNTLKFDAYDVKLHAIVHEATHAVIDATHKGVTITIGTGEAAAYLAEMIYAIVTTGESVYLDVPRLTPPVFRLASAVLAHNSSSKAAYTCPSSDVMNIISTLAASSLPHSYNTPDRMDGIGE